MLCGAGDDSYMLDSLTDMVVEAAGDAGLDFACNGNAAGDRSVSRRGADDRGGRIRRGGGGDDIRRRQPIARDERALRLEAETQPGIDGNADQPFFPAGRDIAVHLRPRHAEPRGKRILCGSFHQMKPANPELQFPV